MVHCEATLMFSSQIKPFENLQQARFYFIYYIFFLTLTFYVLKPSKKQPTLFTSYFRRKTHETWSSVNLPVKPTYLFTSHFQNKTHDKREAGGGVASGGAAAGFSVEVPVDQDQRSHQGPDVERHADPARADLDPHGGPPASHGLVVGLRAA